MARKKNIIDQEIKEGVEVVIENPTIDVDAEISTQLENIDQEVKEIVEEKKVDIIKEKNIDLSNFKFIRMKIDYKVSYRSGWLKQNNIYDINDIEGCFDTAIKLIETDCADWIEEKPERVSQIPRAYTYEKQGTNSKTSVLTQLKNLALSRGK